LFALQLKGAILDQDGSIVGFVTSVPDLVNIINDYEKRTGATFNVVYSRSSFGQTGWLLLFKMIVVVFRLTGFIFAENSYFLLLMIILLLLTCIFLAGHLKGLSLSFVQRE
jgi:hypothetical protein